jgi:hypothetical protein
MSVQTPISTPAAQPATVTAPSKNVIQNFGDGAGKVMGDYFDSVKDILTLKGDFGDVSRVISSGLPGVLPLSMFAGAAANAFTGGQWLKDRQ